MRTRMRTKVMALLLPLFSLTTTVWADVEINETNFPDENFREWVIKKYGSDGVLTNDEIAKCTSIIFQDWTIQSLKGIEYFTALKTLDCRKNKLIVLDVSKNTELTDLNCEYNDLTLLNVLGCTSLKSLNCEANELIKLDVSGCVALTNLDCSYNDLIKLDVSGCIKLKTIRCESNQIAGKGMDALVESLPIVVEDSTEEHQILAVTEPNPQTYQSGTGRNVMTTKQVEDAKAKGWIPLYLPFKGYSSWQNYGGSDDDDDVGYNPSDDPVTYGVTINETNFPDENFRDYLLFHGYGGSDGVLKSDVVAMLATINVEGKNIQSLKGIEHFTALIKLTCSNNQLTTLDVSKHKALRELWCSKNQLTVLDVSKNMQLRTLSCSTNQLTTIDASKHTALVGFGCSYNPLTLVDLSGCTALTDLWLDPIPDGFLPMDGDDIGQIISVNLSGCTSLETLRCRFLKTKTIDLSGCHALKTLDCHFNELSGLNLSDCTALEYLNCGDNQLKTLDVTGCTALEDLRCINNQLTKLDVSGCVALEELYCNNNQLTALDVTGCKTLKYLKCNDNQLTKLDASGLTALENLYCESNRLAKLNVTGCAALEKLKCNNNQLTTLDFTGCTSLIELKCWLNQIKGTGMDVLVESLPTVSKTNSIFDEGLGEMLVIWNENEQNEMTTTQVETARAKGWKPEYRRSSDWRKYDGSDPDGISSVPALFKDEGPIYDLNGRKLAKMQKGINILRYADGSVKKVMVK